MLIKTNKNVHIRVPVVPGINDGGDEIKAREKFLAELDFKGSAELLPFHKMAAGKYESLGMTYQAADIDIK